MKNTAVYLPLSRGGLLFGYDTAVISWAIGFLQEQFELTAVIKAGRKPLMVIRSAGMGVSLAAIGLAATFEMVVA